MVSVLFLTWLFAGTELTLRLTWRTRWLPHNLETGWVALAPIPVGKRCLAVTYSGKDYRTQLFSRLKGARFLKFPSPLPMNSILDCVLDANWEVNGIIHVLDILRWHGKDFTDCEANFRFWWRDSRISEITPLPPSPSMEFDFASMAQAEREIPLTFQYPYVFLPVPYYTPPISMEMFLTTVIPAAKMTRSFEVKLPPALPSTSWAGRALQTGIATDGLLLYVSEASYQSGETPLSTWVPTKPLEGGLSNPVTLDLFEA
ncbi:uncharacterized protein EI90DRAFT_2926250 [Cantharellus anzutake]|uniref:uncharacterized protein n=1 Tax=Cantharellus anzutake TaxID=1750568 RepID=UPI0019088CC1|nr:uncharacterized protein EI90DRAFT_2926250 [Cantharellus anzutake]KAF8328459.1 hypothetical protein EI90DRAFT_2926250 [Cantharellus anzutake]